MSVKKWLDVIRKNDGRWAKVEEQLVEESKASLKVFKAMAKYGFVSVNSQEGLKKRGESYFPMHLYLKVWKEMFPRHEKEEQEEEEKQEDRSYDAYWIRQKKRVKQWDRERNEAFIKAGGKIIQGVNHSERAFLTLVTCRELAENLYYMINRFTSFVCTMNTSNAVGRGWGTAIPVTYAIGLRFDKEYEPTNLGSFIPMGTWISAFNYEAPFELETGGMFDMKTVPEKVRADLVTMQLVDPRHGYNAHKEKGLFTESLRWMECALDLTKGKSKCIEAMA